MEFSNREIATFIWGCVMILFVLRSKDVRKSVLSFVKILFSKHIITILLLSLVYFITMVFILYKINFWDYSMIKDTVLWYLFVSIFLLMNGVTSKNEKEFFISNIISCFKLSLIIEFIINTYSFSLLIELIILPLITLVVLMAEYARHKKEYRKILKPMQSILSMYGLILIGYSFLFLLNNSNEFFNIYTLKSFLLPQILTILYILFVYILYLYSKYETIFIKFKIENEISKEMEKYIKKEVFIRFNFKVNRAQNFFNEYWYRIRHVKDKEDFNIIIEDYLNK